VPSPLEAVTNLDDYGAWVAAVVAGLVAVGWIIKRVALAARGMHLRAKELGRKIDALDVLAARELTDPEGSTAGDSTKSLARQAAGIALAVESLEQRMTAGETSLEALGLRVRRLEEWKARLPHH
jgi:hypothetical protein